MKTPWYSVLNRGAGKPVEILIYDEIGGFGISASELINLINAASSQPILLRINSPGGSVFDGYAIYNALSRHAAGVEVEIEGIAASIASYIAMAGNPIRMAENALLMIHNPSMFVGGDEEEMRRAAEMLGKCKDSIIQAYAKKTGLSNTELSAMMDSETWFSADEAKAKGFIDEVSAPMKAAALFDSSNFRNPPTALQKTIPKPKMKILSASIALAIANLTGAKVTEDSAEADVQNAISGLVKKSDLDTEKTKVTNLTTELEGERSKVTNLTTELGAEKTKVTNLTTELNGEKSKVTDLTTKHGTSEKRVGLLEAFCRLSGIDPKDAPAELPEPKAKQTIAQWETRMKAARTPEDRAKVTADFNKAIAAGEIA